jgi:uncharacterized membrane protein (DUF4010 family)
MHVINEKIIVVENELRALRHLYIMIFIIAIYPTLPTQTRFCCLIGHQRQTYIFI